MVLPKKVILSYDQLDPTSPDTRLNKNHSHCILVEDFDTSSMRLKGFGCELALRSKFELSLAQNWTTKREDWESIHDSLIPIVSVCVQGGAGTLENVFKNSENSIPTLLVGGSGQAADLLCDLLLFIFANNSELALRSSSGNTQDFKIHIAKNLSADISKNLSAPVHRSAQQDKLFEYLKMLKEHTSFKSMWLKNDWKFFAKELRKVNELALVDECIDDNLVSRTKELFEAYEIMLCTPYKHIDCFIYALEAVCSDMCWIHDVLTTNPLTDDFNGALLKCMLLGTDVLYQEKEIHDTLALGLKWEEVDSQKLPTGTQIINIALASALTGKFELTKEEGDLLNVWDISCDSYIKVGESYLKPLVTRKKDETFQYLWNKLKYPMMWGR